MERNGHKNYIGQIGHKVSYETPFESFESFDLFDIFEFYNQ